MTDKLQNIKTDEIKLNEDGIVEISDELQEAIAGGIDPESLEDEGNGICLIIKPN
ncbi:hypothetical protein [uncultured Shewanella sp.]|uniref:hypothetical protein n=1 Tax=uncultured Shewanella sp. TaxID=173975 RepID=UPI002604ECAF|nr:hypothetical protein [uncultured Shewanella sp.]